LFFVIKNEKKKNLIWGRIWLVLGTLDFGMATIAVA